MTEAGLQTDLRLQHVQNAALTRDAEFGRKIRFRVSDRAEQTGSALFFLFAH